MLSADISEILFKNKLNFVKEEKWTSDNIDISDILFPGKLNICKYSKFTLDNADIFVIDHEYTYISFKYLNLHFSKNEIP